MLADDVMTTPTRYGEMSYYKDDEFIGHSLEKFGEYSEEEVTLWRKLIKTGATVIDAGANIGALTLPLAEIVGPQGAVYAFEPQPENFSLLLKNVEVNGLDEFVHIKQIALGEDETKVNIPYLEEMDHSNYGRVELGEGSLFTSIQTLDALQINPSFIKIDVEGFEAQVLNGARETIKRCRPILYVEDDRPDQVSKKILRLMRDLDYRLYEHRPRIYTVNNFKHASLKGERPYISKNVLGIPKEVEVDDPSILGLRELVPTTPNMGKSGWACIVRLGGVGDNLIAASTLRPLKEMGYKIDVITQAPQSVIFENNPFIDKLSVKKKEHLPDNDAYGWQKWFWSRGQEYDKFVNLSHSVEGLLAQFKVSSAFWWPAPWRRQLCGRSYLEVAHDIVGVPYTFGRMFFPTDEEKRQSETTYHRVSKSGRRKVVGWCITGSRPDKIWPQSAMAIGRMIRELDVAVVMLGAPLPMRDFELAQSVEQQVIRQNGSNEGLYLGLSPADTDSWPIRRILTMAQTCDLVISPDTGPAWAVAMEPMPKIILHSHASAENICKHWINTMSLTANPAKVPCWPCHCLHDNIDTCQETQAQAGMIVDAEAPGAACIMDISTERVVTTAAKLLNQGQ